MYAVPPYQYTPLDLHEEIRLLVLEGAGIRETPSEKAIACSLIQVRLACKPTYRALSHRWGDATDMRQLLVNSHLMWIRKNLWYALWHTLVSHRARTPQA